jgi:hypothetical protein
MSEPSPADAPGPEFGPSGHLPARAAARARKIVLRAPLGRAWIVASIVAGVVVAIASGWFLVAASAPPGPPWTELGPLEALAAESRPAGTDVLVVTVGGRVRAFVGAEGVRLCAASNRLESTDGRVWALTGRGLAGTPSLATRPTLVHRGVVHLDPTTLVAGPDPSPEAAEPACP